MAQKTRKFSRRILLIVLLSYSLTSFYYIYNLYLNKIKASEDSTLLKLESISRTLSNQIEAMYLQMIYERYEEKDAVTTKFADPDYRMIVESLENARELNDLPTDVYILSYDSLNDKFFFGPTSGQNQYFRHEYSHPPEILKEKYNEGAVINRYEDENGTWLSAFYPLKNNRGETVGVVQADMPFDHFIDEAREDLLYNIIINSIIITLVVVMLFYWLQTLLRREERIMKQLSINNEIINKKNEDITASISYAKRIQQSLMDSENKLKSLFPSSFIMYEPKDMVSGDFYWVQSLNEKKTKIAVAAADCTGHGVPGALVSVLGITHLREITANRDDVEPGEILEELNVRIIDTFSNVGKGITSKDGMDISLTLIDFEQNTMCFAGAYRPLILIRDGKLTEISGDKQPIGGDHFIKEREFTNHKLEFQKGDWLYMFSDGYIDQFGGDKKKKYMKKRFKDMLVEIHNQDCDSQNEYLSKEMKEWMGDTEQIDDITVLGLQLN